jgi:enolase
MPLIELVIGRRVWDSRGWPAVEAEVTLKDGARGRAIAPAGASRGKHEAVDLRDGGRRLNGRDVRTAIGHVNGPINAALLGQDASRQEFIDDLLIELDGTANKSRLGGNALIAVSMAVLQAAAAAAGRPLWRHLAGDAIVRLPLPEVQIFGGGAHAGHRVDIQDFLVIPVGAESFEQAIEMCAEVYHSAGTLMERLRRRAGVADEGGWWPDFKSNEEGLDILARAIDGAGYRNGEVKISLDIAASELGTRDHYHLKLEGRTFDTASWIEMLMGWIQKYPILSIEDPVAEEDYAGMKAFTAAVGRHIQVVGDDFLVTDADRISAAIKNDSCNAALLKPNQVGTISEMRQAHLVARKAGWGSIVSARSGESEDVAIVHLATGWDVGQLKVGSMARSERCAKWNEAIRIEAEHGSGVVFAGCSTLPASCSLGLGNTTRRRL